MTTLTFERSGVANLHIPTRRRVRELMAAARTAGRADDPVVRQELAGLWAQAELQRLLSERASARARQGVAPGPESSLIKLVWSRVNQDLSTVAARTLRLDGLAGEWGRQLVNSRAASIAGGTSEINKNVVAEQALGLPREPRVDPRSVAPDQT
jgi:alkylation response protein AidB-like acyl-CoA dehydrogenase